MQDQLQNMFTLDGLNLCQLGILHIRRDLVHATLAGAFLI